jgi:hypothetical protein
MLLRQSSSLFRALSSAVSADDAGGSNHTLRANHFMNSGKSQLAE